MTETTSQDEERLIARVRRHLDAGAADLDGATLARLREARETAVAAARRGSLGHRRGRLLTGHPPGAWLLPAGAFASVVATAVALGIMVAEPANGIAREVADLEMLTAGEEIALYENLEFYQWLDDRERKG